MQSKSLAGDDNDKDKLTEKRRKSGEAAERRLLTLAVAPADGVQSIVNSVDLESGKRKLLTISNGHIVDLTSDDVDDTGAWMTRTWTCKCCGLQCPPGRCCNHATVPLKRRRYEEVEAELLNIWPGSDESAERQANELLSELVASVLPLAA